MTSVARNMNQNRVQGQEPENNLDRKKVQFD